MLSIKFSTKEVRDIFIATVVLSLAFGGIGSGLEAMVTSFIIVGIAFLSHEIIGHKFVANYLGFEAEFRKWTMGLVIALLGSFLGFIFAAPGAVYTAPIKKGFAWTVQRATKKDLGLISIGGPVVNIVLGFLFFLLTLPLAQFSTLLLTGARISFFLAGFNLVPFHPLDGGKVIEWNKIAWFLSIATAAAGYLLVIYYPTILSTI